MVLSLGKYRLSLFLLLFIAAFVALPLLFPNVSVKADSKEYNSVSIHDPSIFQDPVSGNYYCYGTHITAAKSKDLKSWESFADGYTVNNKLFAHLYLDEFADVCKWIGDDKKVNIWALDVVYSKDATNMGNDPYFMYVTVVDGNYKAAICLATSSSPEGPFRYKGKIVCSDFTREDVTSTNMLNVLGVNSVDYIPKELQERYFMPSDSKVSSHDWYRGSLPDCIDPAAYFDGNGNMYMLYGSFTSHGGLRVIKMDSVTGLRSKDNYEYLSDGTSDPYFGKQVANNYGEGGFILPVKSDLSSTGYYYFLYYSQGGLEALNSYNMRMFRSEYPDHGFIDAAGNSSLSTKVVNTRLGVRVMDNFKFSYMKYCSSSNGGNSALVNNEGKILLTYHSKSDDGTENHVVKTNQMFMNKDGWLVTSPFIYSGETLSKVSESDVVGNYEYIYHRLNFKKHPLENPSEYYVKSISITLQNNHTISGAYNGTWSMDGNDLTITIDGLKYQSVVYVAKDEAISHNEHIVFTGIGSDNRSIWGAKYQKTDKECVDYDSTHIEVSTDHKTNFTLLNIGTFGSSIKWTSNNSSIKIIDGVAEVTRSTKKDVTVTLTALVKKGKVSKTVKLKVKVLKKGI